MRNLLKEYCVLGIFLLILQITNIKMLYIVNIYEYMYDMCIYVYLFKKQYRLVLYFFLYLFPFFTILSLFFFPFFPPSLCPSFSLSLRQNMMLYFSGTYLFNNQSCLLQSNFANLLSLMFLSLSERFSSFLCFFALVISLVIPPC